MNTHQKTADKLRKIHPFLAEFYIKLQKDGFPDTAAHYLKIHRSFVILFLTFLCAAKLFWNDTIDFNLFNCLACLMFFAIIAIAEKAHKKETKIGKKTFYSLLILMLIFFNLGSFSSPLMLLTIPGFIVLFLIAKHFKLKSLEKQRSLQFT